MKVLKFGGTSVGSAEGLHHVKDIVLASARQQQVVVVVSALSGVTNQLEKVAASAIAGNEDFVTIIDELRNRHHTIIGQVVDKASQEDCADVIDGYLDDLLRQAKAFAEIRHGAEAAQDRFWDLAVSFGELMSSVIVTAMIPGTVSHYAPEFIKTRHSRDKGPVLSRDFTNRLIRMEFFGSEAQIHLTQGFIAQDRRKGFITNLGRGGSDLTAALIAAALKADCLEIWTDVDGFYDSDPRKNPDAVLLPEMTFDQAQELADAGAKVVYPPTLAPVKRRKIKVWVKNTFNPSAPGTFIHN